MFVFHLKWGMVDPLVEFSFNTAKLAVPLLPEGLFLFVRCSHFPSVSLLRGTEGR